MCVWREEGEKEVGVCVWVCDCMGVCVIVWMGEGIIIAWVRKGVWGWDGLD